jgi:hypothetical protein
MRNDDPGFVFIFPMENPPFIGESITTVNGVYSA